MERIKFQGNIIRTIGVLLRTDPKLIRSSMRLKEDLKMDNLDKMEIIMDIESMYNIEIDDSYIDRLVTIKDIYILLKNIKRTLK